jgi:hypothetical protein
MSRRIKVLIPTVLTIGALAAPMGAQGASTKTCTESGTPHKNFTTTNTQTSACNSNSDVNSSPLTATNSGGNAPPGQQP